MGLTLWHSSNSVLHSGGSSKIIFLSDHVTLLRPGVQSVNLLTPSSFNTRLELLASVVEFLYVPIDLLNKNNIVKVVSYYTCIN